MATDGTDAVPPLTMLGHAWLVTTLNPKSILFFVAFVPQFIDPAGDFARQAVILTATFVALAFVNALGYAMLGTRARGLVRSPHAMRVVNRTGGSALIGAGVLAALGPRVAN